MIETLSSDVIMEIDLYKAIPIGVSSIAIIISIATIFFTRQNLKRQLRLSKLEEILEILLFLESHYQGLFMLFKDTEHKVEFPKNQQESSKYLNDLTKYKESFIKLFDYQTLINKVSRLNVLTKAYLPNKKNLKNKSLTIADVYFAMFSYVNFDGKLSNKQAYTIIPKPPEMKFLIAEMVDQIIFEMKLGYKNIGDRDYYKYYKNHFQKDLSNATLLVKKKLEQERSTSGNSL
ncbi:hypothetical protein [Flavobacterium sp.]|uniref:hypothetical protein n=1 Tax=Flavobacterium sp. TaxID=239 RepID=UPI0039E3C24B